MKNAVEQAKDYLAKVPGATTSIPGRAARSAFSGVQSNKEKTLHAMFCEWCVQNRIEIVGLRDDTPIDVPVYQLRKMK